GSCRESAARRLSTRLRDSFMQGTLVWYRTIMERARRNRRPTCGSLTGRNSLRVSVLRGMFVVTARRLCVRLTGSTTKNMGLFTDSARRNNSHHGVPAPLCLLLLAVWTIHGPAFLVEIRTRYA